MPFEVIERLVKRAVQDRDLPLLGGDQPTLPERLQGDAVPSRLLKLGTK